MPVLPARPENRDGVRGPGRGKCHPRTDLEDLRRLGIGLERPDRQEALAGESFRLEGLRQQPGESPQVSGG